MIQKRISVYIRAADRPSSYYRILQYINRIQPSNISINIAESRFVYNLKQKVNNKIIKALIFSLIYIFIAIKTTISILKDLLIFRPKIIIISREMFPRYVPIFSYIFMKKILVNRTVIWDFDDNILESREISKKEWMLLGVNSNIIVVTHKDLKNFLNVSARNKVVMLPTTDCAMMDHDIKILNNKRLETYKNQIILIWVGTSVNLKYVESIIHIINQAAKTITKEYKKKVLLKIVCDKPLLANLEFLTIDNIKWTRQRAVMEMELSHIGIMPLENNKFTIGKGAFKLIQYESAGMPVLGSNVGFNSAAVDHGVNGFLIHNSQEWIKYLINLSIDQRKWAEMSAASRRKWESEFNCRKNLAWWRDIITDLN
ncbi:glycosyltransferase [Sporolactobacillus laevolacticus]|uniref:glycosyltransferase n=1 Tax=Sporolactobacillus laevolacticus TaxID=33018 RepID=UPI0025B3A96B|nr:glycosyltransferase [Sporolactobacillus laevolacticus]MDN3954746.1 glycosyltransferase [Sporolactobacillus laevolacticus]